MSLRLTITSVGKKEQDATEKHRQYYGYTVRLTGDIKIVISDDGTLVSPEHLGHRWRPRR